MIVFDCEQLRKPNTGFYTYCDRLGAALAAEAVRRDVAFGFYLPSAMAGRYGDSARYLSFRHWHKYCLPMEKDAALWHCTHQRSRYLPSSRKTLVLTTIHDLNYLYLDCPAIQKAAFRAAWQHSVDVSSRIVTISEASRRDLIEHLDLHGRQVDVVYNGVDRYDGPFVAPEDPPRGPFLLSVCRVVPSKNLACLPALLCGNSFELFLVGDDRDRTCCASILAAARRWGVQDRVHITGPVPEAEKQWYLRHCEAFLFPSFCEGFGLPVLEALQYGKPVFCSTRCSLPEVGGDVAFYFNEGFDARAMQEEFRQGMDAFAAGCLPDEKVRAHLAKFSWERAAGKYFEIYSSMLPASRA